MITPTLRALFERAASDPAFRAQLLTRRAAGSADRRMTGRRGRGLNNLILTLPGTPKRR